jgi:hypothetical protein
MKDSPEFYPENDGRIALGESAGETSLALWYSWLEIAGDNLIIKSHDPQN